MFGLATPRRIEKHNPAYRIYTQGQAKNPAYIYIPQPIFCPFLT